MKFALAASLVLAAVVGAQNGPTINTPSNVDVRTCRPYLITWSGGKPPYFLCSYRIVVIFSVHGDSADGPIVYDFGSVTGNSITWTPDTPAGGAGFVITDDNGATSKTATFNINTDEKSCFGKNLNQGAAASASQSLAQASASAAASASASAASAPAPSNAASPNHLGNMGIAGALGAAIAAILA
ncbi:hypothetical protein HGRIS_004012 [Hohenbuehelia grisea]|uniref:Uncharacterized protein n=1 Tax=Hohenbuehelia grisea TaxID=104357 RepID=A0ABR3JI06_9AGAR